MATKIIEGKFMPQYKTAAQWSIANPVLLRGETGVESDTRKFKFGDGVNHWNDLEYANKAYPADIKMTDWAKMLESAYSPITNTDTLLAALQKLQVLVDNGDAYLFRCYGTNSTMAGVAFGSPDGSRMLRAICYNSWVNKILVCIGEITLPAFIRMSETEQAAWLGEHTEYSMSVADIQLGTNIANGSHEDWIESTIGGGYKDIPGGAIYLDHTLIRGKQITYRVELKGEDAQAPQLGFEIRVHFTDNTDQWIARYSAGDIPERGTFEKAYTFSSQIQDKEIEYARLYPVFRSLDGGEVSGKLYVRHELVGVGNTLPSTWSPSVADQKKYTDETVGEAVNGVETLIDASNLDQNTYYPVTIKLDGLVRSKITVRVNLSDTQPGKPAWATYHENRFSCQAVWHNNGNAYGSNYDDPIIEGYQYRWANYSPIGSVGQMTNSSNEYIYVRGGGVYRFFATNAQTPVLHTEVYTVEDQTVDLKTSVEPLVSLKSRAEGAYRIAEELQGEISDIQIGGVNIFSLFELEQGAINNSTGVPAASNTRLRSKSFYPISGKYISVNSFNSIYKFLWLFYDNEYSHIDDVVSWNWITSFPTVAEIPEGAAYVKYMIVRNDNAVLTPDDAKEDCLIKVELGNKPSLSWSPSVADLQVTDPVTISDFKNLPSVVTSAADGVIIPVVAPVSASNGPAGLSSAGPAYGHVQVAKTGSTKAYNFLVQTDGSGATKVYSGFLHSTAQTVSWTELGGNSGGRLRDVKLLTTSFWNLISSNDTDIQAFVVDENSPEVPAEYKGEGFGFARHYRDDVGMATVTIKLNSGSVKTFNVTFYGDGSDAYWEELGGSSGSSGGMEKISNWTDLRYAMVNSDEGQGQMVTLPLTRALKSTDIVLVTWRKENASNVDADIAGHAIFHPGAYSYDVGLEVVEDFQDSSNNYGLYLDQNTSEIGSTSLSAYAMSLGGNSYGPHYLITGIYNISGK